MRDEKSDSVEGNSERSDLLTLYGLMFETLRHEGNGIWERFNILVAFNLALFAAVGLLCIGDSRPAFWRGFGIAISATGLCTGVDSIHVLRRLWDRHWRWRRTLQVIEEQFPANWPRAFDQARQSVVELTTPFLVIFPLAWIALLILLV